MSISVFNRKALAQHTILIAFMAVWAFEAFMNALYGYEWGAASSKPKGLLYGGIFLAFAFIGAWLGVKFLSVKGQTLAAWLRRAAIGLPLAGCFALSQVTGWSVFGLTLSDGSAVRETKDITRKNVISSLKRAQDDRALLGPQPSPAEIQAKIDKELSTFVRREEKTIGQLTSNCAKPDWAPTACKRVAEFKVALQSAERAVALDTKIAEGGSAVGKVENIGEAGARTSVLRKLTGGTDEDLDFALTLFIVFMIGFFANLGATLAGFADRNIANAIGAEEAATAYLPPQPLHQETHHHYGSPPPLPSTSLYPTGSPVNVTLQLDHGRVTPLRPRDALALQPEDDVEPNDPLPRFLGSVPNPSYPLYAKVFHQLQIKPEFYINLSKPVRALAMTTAGAFRRYVRTIPALDAEITKIENTALFTLNEALQLLITDVKDADDHVRMMDIQAELRANFKFILLLPDGPYEKCLLHVVERFEQNEHDSRYLPYIRQLRHAVATNSRTTDVDWRQLYQVLQ